MVRTTLAPACGSIGSCAKMVVVEQPSEGAPSMRKSITDLSSVTTVGLDLAKHVFQVHCIDAVGRVIVAKGLRRNRAKNAACSISFYRTALGRTAQWSPPFANPLIC